MNKILFPVILIAIGVPAALLLLNSKESSVNTSLVKEDLVEEVVTQPDVELVSEESEMEYELFSGGVGKDVIPSIDQPEFKLISDVDYIGETELGISVSINGESKFYPYQILVWHEIVNDTVGGSPAAITYCPLCFTGIVIDPVVDGKRLNFGVSGKLWNSNLVMYDRESDSLWVQANGKGIEGEYKGERLSLLDYSLMEYGDFKSNYPEGIVLSRKTNTRYLESHYNRTAYNNGFPEFPLTNEDDRLPREEKILGVEIDEMVYVVSLEGLKKEKNISYAIGDSDELKITWNDDTGISKFTRNLNGVKEDIIAVPAFWFSYAAIYPDLELIRVE